MKTTMRFLLAIGLLGLFSSVAALADESATQTKRTFGLSYSPVQALFGAHRLQLEYNLNDRLSMTGSLGVINTSWSIKPGFNNQPGTFFEILGGPRFYLLGAALDHGLYIQSDFFFVYGITPGGVAITTPYSAGPNMFILGSEFQLGYQYVSCGGFFMEVYAALTGYVGWNFPNSNGTGDAGSYNLNIWQPNIGGKFGYAW